MHKIGILIITMNRYKFLLRQLDYYLSVGCPHVIYIGDSSDSFNKDKIQKKKLKKYKINWI